MLTHGNMACAVISNLYGSYYIRGGALMSYLPLAHIYAVRFFPATFLPLWFPDGLYYLPIALL
jgi:long-subunit acyl-CoA synthetase (AMP-forming)